MARESNLSRDQFNELHGDLLNPKVGGFTVNVQTGERPTKGWVVANEGHEERIPNDELRPSHLPRFVRNNRAELTAPGRAFGGWNNPEEDATYLDVSNDPWSTQKTADVFAILENQKSIEQLHDGGGTIKNPHHDPTLKAAWKDALEWGGSPEEGPDFLRRHG
jgi:hypothetical protein